VTLGAVDRVAVERFVEHALLGPFDLTIRMVQEVPVAIDRVRRQVVLARFIGKLAVDHGVLELRRRLDPPVDTHTPATVTRNATADPEGAARSDAAYGDTTHGDTTQDETGQDETTQDETTQDDTRQNNTGQNDAGYRSRIPEVAELALPDYEHLPAAHIVAKLAGLQQSDRDAIELFESNHRHRRTILGKLEQLRRP
jgi:hypothetical protein